MVENRISTCLSATRMQCFSPVLCSTVDFTLGGRGSHSVSLVPLPSPANPLSRLEDLQVLVLN